MAQAQPETEEERRNFSITHVLVKRVNSFMDERRKLTLFSQELRKNQTKEESLLWYRFLSHYPLRFRRQYKIDHYIVDFYCHKAKLAVELDGSQHYEPEEMRYDAARTSYLEEKGIHIIRFSNLDVLRQFDRVCEAIDLTVKDRIFHFNAEKR